MLVTCTKACTLTAKKAQNAVNMQAFLHIDSTGEVYKSGHLGR